ncbi:MFS transporter [Bradyrhizobium sp. RP6]|uniref:MFS transporter n=1 Tax=Bradyrhizobium sp. RP6 TaxID=2489596 RepID=UPI000F52A425|nr:MFS transporter [Bradyrhizobium sp. RP6]RQH14081.1 MFS transporter [Bradyrhizobium sp. RP6]
MKEIHAELNTRHTPRAHTDDNQRASQRFCAALIGRGFVKTAPSLSARDLSVALTLGLGAFFTNLDVTAVVIALPAMEHTLGFGMAATAWVIDAYSLAFTGMLLAAGAIADRFGRRRALLTGNAIFLVASLACGLAWNGPSLWLARGLQGIGAAFVVTGALALVASAFPDAAVRARVFALLGVVSGVGMAVGPTLGGVITAWTGWRWIFFINMPFCVALIIVVPRLVAESQAVEKRARYCRRRPVDDGTCATD